MLCPLIAGEDGFQYLEHRAVEKIRKEELDFILLFSGFKTLKGKILESTRHGIWTYINKTAETPKIGPPCFWEIFHNEHVTEISLLKLTQDPCSFIPLKRGFINVINDSYRKSIDQVFVHALKWAKEVCQNIIENKTDLDVRPITIGDLDYKTPNSLQILKLALILAKEKLSKFIRDLFFLEQWNIGCAEFPIHKIIAGEKNYSVRWILSPSLCESFADPFLIKTSHGTYLFFENHRFPHKNANISLICKREAVKTGQTRIALRKPVHLSFPFLFEHDGDIFMIPEAWKTKKIALYKAIDFPLNWKEVSVLVDNVSGVDPILFKYGDRYWLAFTSREHGPDINLFLYYASDITGPWSPHKRNPVKTDVRSSRSAGNVFELVGDLIRPAQDCSQTYGGRISLNKIKRLTPEEFEEDHLGFIEPNPKEKFNRGIHTINAIDDKLFLDGKRYVFKLDKILSIRRKSKSASDSFPRWKSFNGYRFLDVPKFIEPREYSDAIREVIEILKKEKGIVSIFQMGHIKHPGISDVDLIAIFEDNYKCHYDLRKYLSSKKHIFPHSLGGISRAHFDKVQNYAYFHNLRLLWGEKLKHGLIDFSPNDIATVKRQIALEYLLENYMNLTIQKRYRVLKLRSLFQNLKAIRYDLEFLGISSGNLHSMVLQLHEWLDFWFKSPLGASEIVNWVGAFYEELESTLKTLLEQKPIYIPPWGNLKLGTNIAIEARDTLSSSFSGFSLPSMFSGLSKKAFNLNTRMNFFVFHFPFVSSSPNRVLEERFVFFKEIKDYGFKCLPHFLPLVTSLAYKIV